MDNQEIDANYLYETRFTSVLPYNQNVSPMALISFSPRSRWGLIPPQLRLYFVILTPMAVKKKKLIFKILILFTLLVTFFKTLTSLSQ